MIRDGNHRVVNLRAFLKLAILRVEEGGYFIITAYLTSDTTDLERRVKIWPNPF
jgi:hypothetical protein